MPPPAQGVTIRCGAILRLGYNAFMTVLNAHFDAKHIVLDDPMPTAIPVNAKVRVIVEEPGKPQSLQQIAEMAVDTDLPADFSTQHGHYTKGHPRK